MAKLFSCVKVMVGNGFPVFTFLLLTFGLCNFIAPIFPAKAATAEELETVCLPESISLPTANLVRTAAIIQRKTPLKILAIGSSSTQGIGATAPNFAYPAQLKTELNTLNSVVAADVRNAGIGGETIEQTLKRLVQELDSYKPDLVLWQVGTNDAITGDSDPNVFRKLIGQGIKSILDRRIDAILIDPQFYLKIPNMAVYEHYVEIIHAAAQDNHITVFPRYRLMQAWNKEPGGITRMMGPDGFHMGNPGYACLANLLANEITASVAKTNTKVAQP